MVEYVIDLPSAGNYKLEIQYTSPDRRESNLFINDNRQQKKILGGVTGGKNPDSMRYFDEGTYSFNAGSNKIRIDRESYFPHLYSLTLSCVD